MANRFIFIKLTINKRKLNQLEMHKLFNKRKKNTPIIDIIIWSIISFILLAVSLSFWKEFSWSEIYSIVYWQEISNKYFVESIAALSFIAMSGIGISILIGLWLAFYFRQFQKRIRHIFLTSLLYFSYIPCLIFGFLFAPVLIELFPNQFILNILIGVLLAFLSVFSLILFQLFSKMNNISQAFIDVGYSLGANDRQIAQKIIIPEMRKDIYITVILVLGRILLEVAIIAIVLGVININILNYTALVIFIILLGVILFLVTAKSK